LAGGVELFAALVAVELDELAAVFEVAVA